MAAHEDVCGCGEWSCRACFGSDAVPGSTKNAWLEEGYPPSTADDRALAELLAHPTEEREVEG